MLFPVACGPTSTVRSPKRTWASSMCATRRIESSWDMVFPRRGEVAGAGDGEVGRGGVQGLADALGQERVERIRQAMLLTVDQEGNGHTGSFAFAEIWRASLASQPRPCALAISSSIMARNVACASTSFSE